MLTPTVMEEKDFEEVTKQLEKEEIEGSCEKLPELHCHLLSIYLCNFDLCNAKLLWKRISAEEKSSTPLLGQIWNVGQKLWLKEHNEVFHLLKSTPWPEPVEAVMKQLEQSYRQRSLQLISKAYLTINMATFSSLMGYHDQPDQVEELLATLQSQNGWTLDVANQLISPKQATTAANSSMRNEDQLQSLTQFVSFLEN